MRLIFEDLLPTRTNFKWDIMLHSKVLRKQDGTTMVSPNSQPFVIHLGFDTTYSYLAHGDHEEMVRLPEVCSKDGIKQNRNKQRNKKSDKPKLKCIFWALLSLHCCLLKQK